MLHPSDVGRVVAAGGLGAGARLRRAIHAPKPMNDPRTSQLPAKMPKLMMTIRCMAQFVRQNVALRKEIA